jgi:peptide deformylase
MAVRPLKIYPDPALRQPCEKVEVFDSDLGNLLDDLAQSMYAHKGLGLAAPQIGISARVAVVDVDQREGQPRLIELVNPVIIESCKEGYEYEEGCLSFPEESELVTRPARVTVRAMDRHGQSFEVTGSELLATAIQHEIDHLDGVLFIDHISRLKRSLVDRRMKKRARATGS